ncbi:MAG: 30S ribosomal protein S12 methylthiotransferase RimO [Acidobacteria bacterium]|nr:30S ribosomal protein S12 methylthiotransferase RimO [Acidobacteriota bacterium]
MKIGFVSLGCPKNLVDSEVMIGLLQQAGHEVTPNAESADVLVVNTCAFIDSAKQESVDAILEMAELKRTGRCRRLVVTGCLAERYRADLRSQIGEIDAVLGTGEIPAIVGAISSTAPARPAAMPVTLYRGASTRSGRTRDSSLGSPRSSVALAGAGLEPGCLYDADTPRTLVTPHHFAYVKVAEGCDYACSFCIIPTLRGAYRSRTVESIVTEARLLAERGVRELILISQDTTCFGVDRGERGALATLLRQLNQVEGIEWIRLLYLYPTTIRNDVLDAMVDCEKICRYVDLPLQHASAGVLKRMKRPGTGSSYRRLLDRIRTRVPDVALRTTLIVGFPGETRADFNELKAFVADVQFDHLGVFTYSHEEGTAAFGLKDDVPASLKAKRRDTLMSLQKRLVQKAQRRRIGQRVRVMVDGPAPEHGLVVRGRLASQAPDIDSCVYLTDIDPDDYCPGQVIEGVVVGARQYDLVAAVSEPIVSDP